MCRLTRPRRLTKLRTTFLSLLANQWMIFPSPQSDRHRIISVVDARGVKANAQTQLLHVHELLYCLFSVLLIHFIFMRKHHSPFRLLFQFLVNDSSRLGMTLTTPHDHYALYLLSYILYLAIYYGYKCLLSKHSDFQYFQLQLVDNGLVHT